MFDTSNEGGGWGLVITPCNHNVDTHKVVLFTPSYRLGSSPSIQSKSLNLADALPNYDVIENFGSENCDFLKKR